MAKVHIRATQKTGYVYQIGLAICVSESDKRTTRLGPKTVRLRRTYGDKIFSAVFIGLLSCLSATKRRALVVKNW
jgi:hypothetical protein